MVADKMCPVVGHNGPNQFCAVCRTIGTGAPTRRRQLHRRDRADQTNCSEYSSHGRLRTSHIVEVAECASALSPAPDYLQFMLGARAHRVYREGAC